ncbi:dolichol kinase [Galleria mellonella]|uniref:dolichol kinase n=1 Tax=Galleria mellonella TaxID=7137 RepID=A0ABM3N4A4_GALME|nr:dolichol kinase [Galleria mellonella]
MDKNSEGNQSYNKRYISSSQKIEAKYINFIMLLDDQITRNLNAAGVETRPVKTNGLWCCFLLPVVLTFYILLYNVSPLYKLVTYMSYGLLFYSILFIVFISISSVVIKESTYGGCVASSLVSALFLYSFLGQDLIFSLMVVSVPVVSWYSYMLRQALIRCPRTFTIGEAMIVIQGIVLFGLMGLAKLFSNLDDTNEETDFINVIIYTVLSTVGIIITLLYLLTDEQRNIQNLAKIFGAGAVFALIILHSVLGASFMLKFWNYIFMHENRVQIFCFWLSLVIIAVLVLLSRTKLAVKANTVTRKSFHILASLVFMSGILLDVNLITLAAGIGLGLLVLVEALRKSRIEPISSALQSAFLVYSDEKDCGSFAMTPLYLYAGLACPLLLVPQHAGVELELLSGVLAIGVGDTAASWFGSHYGFNKWTGSNRTLEGTAFNILSQVATVYALELFELLQGNNALIRTVVAATVTGLVEAKTDQVDNLILPLVSLIAYQATWFIC